MPEDKSELEKTEQRIIEVNEWFTPFQNYDSIPYEKTPDTQATRLKLVKVTIPHVGEVSVKLLWTQKYVDQAKTLSDAGIKLTDGLLVLPLSEKMLPDGAWFEEQRKMEARLMRLSTYTEERHTRELPYLVEVELPTGNLISTQLNSAKLRKQWREKNTGEQFDFPIIPEASNIMEKIQIRIVPKD